MIKRNSKYIQKTEGWRGGGETWHVEGKKGERRGKEKLLGTGRVMQNFFETRPKSTKTGAKNACSLNTYQQKSQQKPGENEVSSYKLFSSSYDCNIKGSAERDENFLSKKLQRCHCASFRGFFLIIYSRVLVTRLSDMFLSRKNCLS